MRRALITVGALAVAWGLRCMIKGHMPGAREWFWGLWYLRCTECGARLAPDFVERLRRRGL